MKNIKYILFIIVLLFTSCALKKEYIIGDSKGITTKKIVKNIEQNQNKFGSLQARAKIDYSSNFSQSLLFLSGNFGIKNQPRCDIRHGNETFLKFI